jgi:hypothetical protein
VMPYGHGGSIPSLNKGYPPFKEPKLIARVGRGGTTSRYPRKLL